MSDDKPRIRSVYVPPSDDVPSQPSYPLQVGRVYPVLPLPPSKPVERLQDPKPLPSFWCPNADAAEVLCVLGTVLQHPGEMFVCDRRSLERVRECIAALAGGRP